MGQIKALDVDWLDEAWLVSAALADLKEYPVTEWIGPGLLGGESRVSPSKKWKLKPPVRARLQQSLQSLTLHLFCRLCVAHKVKMPTTMDGTRWFHEITDPTQLLITWLYLQRTSKTGQPASDRAALEAAFRLASVLKDRYCNPVWKREIPLLVAGVGGKSASAHSRYAASAPRGQRSSRLTDGLAVCVGRNRGASWKVLLDDLYGDQIVINWDSQSVTWRDYDDEHQTTPTGTFRNLLTRIRKSR